MPSAYRGSLVIVPTPIGNLGDLSLRQYEALTQSDIVACEDTRKTGKMIELIKQRRMKDKFKREFGATIEDFFDEKEKDTAATTTKDSVSRS
jgi:16S rRNA C1402 (ribose-2'-O) methylase RsmI